MSNIVGQESLSQVEVLEADNTNEEHRRGLYGVVASVGSEFKPPINQRTENDLYVEYLFGYGLYAVEQFGDEPRNGVVVMAKLGYKTVGLAACLEHIEKYDGAYLICTMVLPEYRRIGIANMLMEARLKILGAKGVKRVSVTTWSTNLASIANLEKAGFEIVKTIPNERGPSIDGMVLSKYL